MMRFGNYYGDFSLLYNSNINRTICLMINETIINLNFWLIDDGPQRKELLRKEKLLELIKTHNKFFIRIV